MRTTRLLILLIGSIVSCCAYNEEALETDETLENDVELVRLRRSWYDPTSWGGKWTKPKEWIKQAGKGYSYLTLYPGTKWCGKGDRANNDKDLGQKKKPDTCCRAHDLCALSAKPGKTVYGIKNTGKITWSHCKCDMKFYNCLKKANTLDSDVVGVAYFDLLDNYCIIKDYPIKCKRKKILGIFKGKKKCHKDTSKGKIWHKKKIDKKYFKVKLPF